MSDSSASTAQVQSDGRAPRPYRKGWRASWKGGWGPLSDGCSRLARQARKIEGELREHYLVRGPVDERMIRLAAKHSAIAEMVVDQVGADPKATPASARKSTLVALKCLAALPRKVVTSPDIAALLAGADGDRR